ncbi:calcium uptake protein 3, mitochondrial-like isoform X8 [Cyprinus carpio]|uniref:Calcium uptake protein 3, mitochondrial-like isoform X8 n=1 Tax=Cyprinus carpio TaxID=7962 RepID=A0A9Q9W2L3_CYPCA|nr:calcium uptake protein 3, mitochondrial-like isoform X8 [Cyprinus carpio]
MAAVRRLGVIFRSLSLSSAPRNALYRSPVKDNRCRRRGIAVAVCVAAGGAVLYYYYSETCGFKRRKVPINGIGCRALLPSLPAVAAKDKAPPFDFDESDVYMSSHEHHFRLFSSVEYEGQLYMTPQNFIESVTMSEPRMKKPWRSLTKQELEKILSDTPPVWKGTSKLFRNLQERVGTSQAPVKHKPEAFTSCIIAYTEYLFLLCILTKPHAGFKIAFNMFDADGNQMVDKGEFLVLQEIFRTKNEKKGRKGDAEKSAQLHANENMMIDSTLLVHFFGKKGKAELTFEDFYRFMDNLQTEMLEIEFLTYSKGMTTISEEDFARILLRYTNVEDIRSYLENVRQCIPDEKGITFDEFRSFFQFLNNLEDFAIAMQMYNFACRSIGQDEFGRAVYVATGLKLTHHLVNTIFRIFDVDHDDQLSYKEFIGIMKDRLHRGGRGYKAVEHFTSFKSCLKKELAGSR